MACRLLGAKPLPQTMVRFFQLKLHLKTSSAKYRSFYSRLDGVTNRIYVVGPHIEYWPRTIMVDFTLPLKVSSLYWNVYDFSSRHLQWNFDCADYRYDIFLFEFVTYTIYDFSPHRLNIDCVIEHLSQWVRDVPTRMSPPTSFVDGITALIL